MPQLWDSFALGPRVSANRLIMPPMVVFGLSDGSGCTSEALIAHYAARKGLGVVVMESTCVAADGRLSADQPGIWEDGHIPGLARIAQAIRGNGSLALIQIHHAGGKTVPSVCAAPLTAGGMSKADIQSVRRMFVAGALRAKEAGFDGVELHGAHGYLLSQFCSPTHNNRADEYGADRFLLSAQIVDDIRRALPPDFVVQYRMGVNEPDLESGIALARVLESAGAHSLHVSGGCGPKPLSAPEGFPYSWYVYGASQVKAAVSVPVIAVNGVRTPAQASGIVEGGLADAVAVGRALLANPGWAVDAAGGKQPATCRSCVKCAWFREGGVCPVNPKRGRAS